MPEGMRWRTVFWPSTTSVCPALFPPWKRTTTSAFRVRRSTTFPFPSSPHCAPITTTFAIVPGSSFGDAADHTSHRRDLLAPASAPHLPGALERLGGPFQIHGEP